MKVPISELEWSYIKLCAGCGVRPVDVGNMGRWKFVCKTYQARDREKVTKLCRGGQGRPMWSHLDEAVSDWNRLQEELDKDLAGGDEGWS